MSAPLSVTSARIFAGETRVCRPGDLLLVEDTVGPGHASTTDEGCTVLMVDLEAGARW